MEKEGAVFLGSLKDFNVAIFLIEHKKMGAFYRQLGNITSGDV